MHVGVPARVIADLVDRVEAPNVGDRSLDLDGDLHLHRAALLDAAIVSGSVSSLASPT
jgi:hypothetical protein